MAVDSCLGEINNVGTITVRRGRLHPGTAVHKHLPRVGEVSIKGIVNIGGSLEFEVLKNTRLGRVMQLADCIARALALACPA